MRAAVMRDRSLVVDDVADPVPQDGQVLAEVLACGICGSDLHALAHPEQMVAMAAEGADSMPAGMPSPTPMDLHRDVVMGHELSARIVDVGPEVHNRRVGDVVVSLPIAWDLGGIHPIGYSNTYPGGYAEQVVLNELLTFEVPDGLDPLRAALTEPMAVGLHAVNRSQITKGEAAVVFGCGPVGLATIAVLALRGIEPIVAADFSPARRALAAQMGAHEVVDPRVEGAGDAWRRVDGQKPAVLFEAVGVPGMIDEAMKAAPRNARILVVGVCMETDTIWPMRAIGRELSVIFSFGYDPMEFAETLALLADGSLDVGPLVTGSVGVDGVPAAFQSLADPEAHAKILVVPGGPIAPTPLTLPQR
jgi:threonine dehydrogenase-like Zn-dependent dehydrogenase